MLFIYFYFFFKKNINSIVFFFSSRRRHTRYWRDWSSDVCSSDLAVIVGHDTGANVAWQAALMRPDRFRAAIGLSVPFRPRPKLKPTSTMPRTASAQFYQLYFQAPGPAEAEMERDPRQTLRNMLFGASGDAPRSADADAGVAMVPHGGGFLRGAAAPAT